eukprot:TRINITY_DN10347_c0_g1_i2.p1 TRINITY_DN10347_c0_g1~~TRINITY_DN10347_c0_g1_i2.p1  ORF type:complete len:109 (-),score=11.23 TRINITY_DN10347_c0_g1_i2:336-662(-)
MAGNRGRKTTTTFAAVFMIYLVLITTSVLSMNTCRLEGVEQKKPEECVYGRYLDFCDTWRCLKGPGDTCGGRRNVHGECGSGLICSNCNRCTGCSYQSFMCWEELDCM